MVNIYIRVVYKQFGLWTIRVEAPGATGVLFDFVNTGIDIWVGHT